MKKTFSKFFATVAAVSMLASVATVVNADEAATPVTYGFTFKTVEAGAVITGLAVNEAENDYVDGSADLTIPAEITVGENKMAVVGVADYAFVGLDNLMNIYVPETLTVENTGNVAFMTKKSLAAYIESAIGAEPTEADIINYVAKEFKYNDKTEGWTEEELAEVKAKLDAKAKLAGVTEDMDVATAVATMLENKAAMNLAPATNDKLTVWEATVTYTQTYVEAPEGSAIEAYVKAKQEALGMATTEVVAGVIGDANGDGVVNVRDAAAIASALAKKDLSTLKPTADYNQDGETNVRDAAKIASDLANGVIGKK